MGILRYGLNVALQAWYPNPRTNKFLIEKIPKFVQIDWQIIEGMVFDI